MKISSKVVIMTDDELKDVQNEWFAKGVARGRFEQASKRGQRELEGQARAAMVAVIARALVRSRIEMMNKMWPERGEASFTEAQIDYSIDCALAPELRDSTEWFPFAEAAFSAIEEKREDMMEELVTRARSYGDDPIPNASIVKEFMAEYKG